MAVPSIGCFGFNKRNFMEFSISITPPPVLKSRSCHDNYYLGYTICFLAACCAVFCWYWVGERTFIWEDDGWNQHYKALVYYGQYLRRAINALFSTGAFTLPNWDFSLGEGADVLSTLHYYVIGDPLNLLAAAFPTRYMWVLYDGLVLLRLYLAGLFFSLLCFYTGIESRYGVLAGSLTYCFCQWGLLNAARHPYFLNPMVYLPLLVLGIEKYLREKKPWLLIGTVFVSAASNFYFFYMLALIVAIYTIVRLLLLWPRHLGKAVVQGLQLAGFCILGTLLAFGILLPMLVTFLSNNRMSVQNGHLLLYPLKYYLCLPLAFFNTYGDYWLMLGFSALTVPAICLLFRCKKEYLLLKVLFCLCIIIMLFPSLGQAFNGFSYISNRWCWSFALLCAYILAVLWPRLMSPSLADLRFLLHFCLAAAAYTTFCCILHINKADETFFFLALEFVFFCLLKFKVLGRKGLQSAALVLTFTSVFLLSYCYNSPYRGNYADICKTIAEASEPNRNEATVIQALSKSDKGSGFYRYSSREATLNAGLLAGLSSTNYYWSLISPAFSDFQSVAELPTSFSFLREGYDDRTALLSLASVRYFVTSNTDNVPAPYGFTPREQELSADYKVYWNDHTLPLTYTYENVLSRSKWEQLNAIEKQEALLQTVVLDDASVQSSFVPELTSSAINYTVSCSPDVVQDGSSFVVTAEDSSVTLNFTDLADCETYLHITGLTYSGFSPDASLAGSDCLGQLWAQLSYVDPSTLNLELESSAGLQKELTYFTPLAQFYSGRHDYAVNLNYNKAPLTSVTITFPETGIYAFDSLEVLCQPMENYASQVDALAQDTLQNLTIGTDRVTGSISLSNDKWLCLAIPYSIGWKAYVDGEAVELHQANIQYMALPLTAGQHHVELIYKTPLLKTGLCISAFTGLVLIGMYVFSRKKESVSI